MTPRLVSERSPYVPITVSLRQRASSFEALLDTGFEGDLMVPAAFAANVGPPDLLRLFVLADGSETMGGIYFGAVDLGPLGTLAVQIGALGDECMIGLRIAHRFRVTLDHGRQIVFEP